ncbi:MAG: M1 family metallopeptidase [Bryobacterales bacterium]|nr:M1 family metallopeptidase [Bryobacterales bacterium]
MTRRDATVALLALAGCESKPKMQERRDLHSFARPYEVRTKHLDLDLEVSFDSKTLRGSVTHTLERTDPAAPFLLDTSGLSIEKVETGSKPEGPFAAAQFTIAPAQPTFGAALTIPLPSDATAVRIHYSTSPQASGLQWLDPSQTAGKKRPFLYSQSQAIHARSWIPCQDTPGVRATYRARIRTPKDLIALMSARSDFRLANPKEPPSGDYSFRMPLAIPAYLIALAVGDLEFRYLSTRTGVWAEPSVVDAAAREFVDTERMMQAAEKLFGPYVWQRYDVLVLPPSFPFGGMENPLLTFATPTILAGDKSLVSLVAHELAHSWSGNLVTNATWSDFWLNEGFTTYCERRIQEAVYGAERAKMEAALGYQSLEDELKSHPPADQILHIDLTGRDPDDGATEIPYEKGALFLTHIEQVFGRETFDKWLRAYFANFQFQSITTAEFRSYLRNDLLAYDAARANRIPLDEWLTKPGLPTTAPKPTSDAFAPVEEVAKQWQAKDASDTKPRTRDWNTHQWLHFLRALTDSSDAAKMAQLDRAFAFTASGNSEILFQWLRMSVRHGYTPAHPRLEEFLTRVGRRKFVRPLFEELLKTDYGRKRAEAIYAKARPGYHPITASTIDGLFSKKLPKPQ